MRRLGVLTALALAALGVWWLASGSPTGEERGLAGDEAGLPAHVPVLEGRAPAAAPREDEAAVAAGPCVLRGSVEDDAGHPLGGIEVRLERYVEPGFLDRAPGRWIEVKSVGRPEPYELVAAMRTGVDGGFTFRGLAVGGSNGYRVRTAAAAPWTPAVHDVFYLRQNAFVRLVLGRADALTLRVVDERGQGLRASVSAWRERGGAGWFPSGFEALQTDAGGRLVVHLPAGAYVCSVRAPGVGSRAGILLEVPQSREVVIPLGLRDGAAVAGRITDSAGKPVSGARILASVSSAGDARFERLTTSGADGAYRVDALPAGELTLLAVHAPGFITVERRPSGSEVGGATVTRLDVTLIRGGVLEGTVRGPDGQVIVGASVQARAEHAREGLASGDRALTDTAGHYRMTAVPPGGGRLRVAARGYYQSEPDKGLYRIDAESEQHVLDITLARGIAVAGRVVDTTGRPVAGAAVVAQGLSLQGWWPGSYADCSTLSDAEGRFSYSGLPPSKQWSLTATTDAGLSLPRVVDTTSGTALPSHLELVVRPGAVVQGRVVREGRAVTDLLRVQARARVGSGSKTVALENDGAFTLTGLPPGEYEVFVVDWELAAISNAVSMTLTWGQVEREVVLSLLSLGRIAGVVVDARGEPVPGLHLLLDTSTPGQGTSVSTQTSRSGAFDFERVPDNGHAFPILIGNLRQPGTYKAGDRDVRIVHEPPAKVRFDGRVLLPDGTPAVRGSVMLWEIGPAGGRGGSAIPIIDGAFGATLERQSGESTFGAEVREVFDLLGHVVSTQPQTIEPVEPGSAIEFRLEAGLEILGVVVDADGTPAAGVQVSLVPKGEPLIGFRHKNMFSRADGSFQFGSLADGAFDLHATRVPAPWVAPPLLPVRAGQKDVRIVLLRGSAIRGRVLDPDGRPLGRALVVWSAGSGTYMRATSGEDGAFELAPLPPGASGTLTASAPAGSEATLVAASIERVRAGEEGMELRLRAGVFIEGVVTGPEGETVPQARLRCEPVAQAGGGLFAGRLGGGTAFKLGPLLPGRYRLLATAGGEYLPAAPVEVDAPAEGVRIVVPKGLTIKGTLTGADQPERFSLTLARMTRDGPSGLSANVMASGQFLVTLAADEAGTLYFHDREGGDLYGLVENVRPSAEPLTVALRTGSTIEGRIHPYEATHQGYVYLQAASGLTLHATVAKDGTFVARAVPPGAYDIHGFSAQQRLASVKAVQAGTKGHVLRAP